MKTEMHRILNMPMFFKVIQSTEHNVKYIFKKPCIILMSNISLHWLKYINTKTQKHMPVFINENLVQNQKNQTLPFGILSHNHINYNTDTLVEHNLNSFTLNTQSEFNFKLIIPQENVMQYFTQWQRYRKFWWSSITTTPSLFSVSDIKFGENTADVEVLAQFTPGNTIVETIKIYPNTSIPNSCCLSCTLYLEKALFILLLDGLSGQNKTNYLKLHKNMAPYKISFAINCKDTEHKQTLQELSELLNFRLQKKKISTWIPNFSLSTESQIQENLQMGVVYTAILNDNTLKNGIFRLMNSSTMLQEQIHVADFDSYASLLCK
ncbi:DNA polymerase subunit gamma-2, mitochondrial [Achroia grisella]|uniref:DNA polymerase subunit gamma-2, mitochondrial n=1 Tax=Achroia grisella TaxID=688607 RepID=UPI0027D2C6A9|nr:DNA polymerase subunit gamma-2, mitochondrial [Achroia grisella]